MIVDYTCGHCNYQITPSRQDAAIQIAREHYESMASSMVKRNPNELVGALSKQVQLIMSAQKIARPLLRRTVLNRILNGRRSGMTLINFYQL